MMNERVAGRKRMTVAGVLGVLLATAPIAGCLVRGSTKGSGADVPMATVQRTNLQIEVNASGELRATQSSGISAPPIAGGTLQIVKLLKTGTEVKAGDVVAEFDPSAEEYNLGQNHSDFEQAEQAILKARDDAAVQVAQDKTALLKAQFAVRQAVLDVSKNEILSAIDAKKNQLALDEAKRALIQLQQDIQSHAAANQAAIDVNIEKANKAKLAMNQAQTNIENMRVKSPIAGLVVVRENTDAAGGIYFTGMTLPDYQEGDQVYPGNIVAQVVNVAKMEVGAKVSEKDRGNVKAGQAVEIEVDGRPNKKYRGTVNNVAGMASGGFFEEDPVRKFDVTIEIDNPDNELRPDFGAHVVIWGDRLTNVLCIPRQAVFEKEGKPTVFLRSGNGFDQREVKVQDVTEGVAVIDGLKEGMQVALVNPVKQAVTPAAPTSSAASSLGGAP
jgi:HlyD family secretion protein